MNDHNAIDKPVYEAPALVRVGSFEQVTKDLSIIEMLTGIQVNDWSNGRVS